MDMYVLKTVNVSIEHLYLLKKIKELMPTIEEHKIIARLIQLHMFL